MLLNHSINVEPISTRKERKEAEESLELTKTTSFFFFYSLLAPAFSTLRMGFVVVAEGRFKRKRDFEYYRDTKLLIMEQLPETATSIIVSFKVDYDIVSLDSQEFLQMTPWLEMMASFTMTPRHRTSPAQRL
ncbi:auxin efflux carrier component 3-like [Senna tora]|uniref:Auxin efflux carrier component 3-like n=1 Tax=Senna tora TaxID=362788 RepID=A0A834W3M6_9FABA|nr:auxin efflux carrier component 3-like [Senna tora]